MMLAKSFLQLTDEEKRQAFLRSEDVLGRVPVVLEKDLWVTWILGMIFTEPELEPHFVFKGGTSLSKVYKIIDRFSEDVDLGIHPAYLGFPEDLFTTLESQTKRTGALVDMQKVCGERLKQDLVPLLEAKVRAALGKPATKRGWLTYAFDERVHAGSFRLIPPPERLKTLEKDYAAMRPMFLSEPQTFEGMMAVLADGEKRINAI